MPIALAQALSCGPFLPADVAQATFYSPGIWCCGRLHLQDLPLHVLTDLTSHWWAPVCGHCFRGAVSGILQSCRKLIVACQYLHFVFDDRDPQLRVKVIDVIYGHLFTELHLLETKRLLLDVFSSL